jgi:hypothetical protein
MSGFALVCFITAANVLDCLTLTTNFTFNYKAFFLRLIVIFGAALLLELPSQTFL